MSREDDLLEQATRALRAEPPPSREELADGRAVLMWAQRSARRKQRGRTLRWVLPLAAVLTAGSALAATGQIERIADAVAEWLAPERVAEPKKPKRARAPKSKPKVDAPAIAPAPDPSSSDSAATATPAPAAPSEPAPSASPAPVTPAPSRSAKLPSRPRMPAKDAVAEPTPVPPPPIVTEPASAPEPEPALKPSPDLAAYRSAHALHFRTRDFRAALAAWDAYLEAYPRGTFAIEAIYNRAICLVRLGRHDEARRVLKPFADGAMQGGYRRAEATQLLEALE